MRLLVLASLAAVLALGPLDARGAIRLVPVVANGLAAPLFVTHAGDGSGRLFIVEQAGVIRVLQPGGTSATVFLDLRGAVAAGGERGLLGLAFHPHYAFNGRFFVFYTRPGDGALVVAEYRASTNRDVAAAVEIPLLSIPHPNFANHNGGMLAFGPDGFLYIGVGDGGSSNDPANNAQSVDTLLGKILRIDVDHPDVVAGTLYSSPADNPYVGRAGRDEIHSIGWRNPWRFSFDRRDHVLWVADVGQGAREEVDAPVVKGGNYGWRIYEGSSCTGNDPPLCGSTPVMPPLFDYAHDGVRCSITGGYVYRGARNTFPTGRYVYGDFCSGEIFSWDGASQNVLLDTTSSIASFGEDEQGELYVVDLAGTLSRIVSDEDTSNDVQEAYVAYYGRPADPAGYAYWNNRLIAEGGSLDAIIQAFGTSSEFTRRYGGSAAADLVTRIYQQTLGRDPDADGLAFYIDALTTGRLTPQTIALDVLNGATTLPDAATVANKVVVADYYTAKIAAGCAYGTEQDGVAVLSGVTADDLTVAATKGAIDARCGS